MIFHGVILILLAFLSLLVFVGSLIGLLGYAINSLFRKIKLPSIRFKIPLFKMLIISTSLSFVVMVGSAITADSLGYLESESALLDKDEENIEENVQNEDNDFKLDKTEKNILDNFAEEKPKESKENKPVKQKKNDKPSKTLPDLEVHFIDVGQADAALIMFQNRSILIDAGDWRGNEVVNYLNNIGITRLDLVVGSHPHADHIGQIDKVIERFPVDEVWMSGNEATSQIFNRMINLIDEKNIGYDEPRAGDQYKIDDLKIDIMSPTNLTGNLNNDSIVMKLTYGSITFLFTGDAEKDAELKMVNSGRDISATVLKVGHHGSNTSTTQSFLNKVNPEVAVISVGESSRYGHPDKMVLDRLSKKGSKLFATKAHGSIIIFTDGTNLNVTTTKTGKIIAGNTDSKSSETSTAKSATSSSKKNRSTSSSDCIDINNANESELQNIIHIGEITASKVIASRPYKSVDELTKVSGIAEKKIADIKAEGKACVE